MFCTAPLLGESVVRSDRSFVPLAGPLTSYSPDSAIRAPVEQTDSPSLLLCGGSFSKTGGT